MSHIPRRTFFSWFAGRRAIYPPTPAQITTRNRLFPTYITRTAELQDHLLGKDPLLVNFTVMADPQCNKLTQSLFDVLSSSKLYPNSYPVSLINISAEDLEAREMMLNYGISHIPLVICLKKQLLHSKYVPSDINQPQNPEVIKWLKSL